MRYLVASPGEEKTMSDALLSYAARILGRKGGQAKSEAKTIANRLKSNLPPKPGKLPRGRPRKVTPDQVS
jgi:hypothetical protein